MVNYPYEQENNWSLEEMQKAAMFDPECGTAYAQMFLLVIAIAAVIVANIGSIGLIRGFGILLAIACYKQLLMMTENTTKDEKISQ